MKKGNAIIFATSLLLGLASTGYAAKSDSNFVDTSNQGVEKYHSLLTAENALNYSEVLLMNSSVSRNLKFSEDPTVRARYEKAKQTRSEAIIAYHAGETAQAKRLALQSIRVITSSIARHNIRVAQVNESNQ